MENNIGERIKQIREENGLTQKEFADRLNSSRSHISGVENNSVPISDRLIKLICMEFGINEEWLRSGKGEKSVYVKAVKKAWDDEVIGLKNIDNFVKKIYENHIKYLKLCALLAPGGVLTGNIPLEHEPDLIMMVNYLQYLFSQAKTDRDKMLITVKFESVFHDYVDVVEKLSKDYKKIQEEMSNTLKEIMDYDKFFSSIDELIEAGKKAEEAIKKSEEILKEIKEMK